MSDDEDWFERALEEADDDADATSADRPDGPAPGVDEGDDGADDRSPAGAPAGDGPDGDDAGDDPFAEDFATAFENAPDPDGAGSPTATDAGPGRDGGADGSEFGAFGGGGGDGPDDIADAFGAGSTTFDDAEFESDIERISIGVEGLDEMILGGVPRRSLMATIGSAGTGKTTFGLQFLRHALDAGDRAIYITLEESRDRILDTADEKGWEFSEYAEQGQLAVVDFDPIEMANSLSSISSELSELVDSFGAARLVLDSVSLLEMMYDGSARRRSEVFEFTRSLKEAGVTTMVTSEASERSAYASRYGIVEYLADAVFILQYVRPSDFRETRLAVEIQKIRDANHSRETKPYEITDDGISVYRQANIF